MILPMTYRLALLGLLLLTAGCSRSILKGDLIGAFASGASQRLELRANGTYKNTYATLQGRSVTEEGTWELERVEDVPTISLLQGANVSGRGYYLMQVGRSGGKIRLYHNKEMGLYLEKER
jgi:hypothetical protein